MSLRRPPAFVALLLALLIQPAFAQQGPEMPLTAPGTTPVESPQDQEEPAGQASPAQDPEGNPLEAEQRGLTSEEVRESVPPDPTEQGTRPPELLEGEEEVEADGEEVDLYAILDRVRRAPPGLDGRPIPRPNPLGSEPAKEMTPLQPEDPSLFPEGYVE